MTEKITLGIDTSNYTTSAALCIGGRIVLNKKIPLPVKEGERGLRQSDAVFAHVKNLPDVMLAVRDALDGKAPDAVGVSVTPRDAEGSYMPCFLSGKAAAYSVTAVTGAPVYEFSHQAGHIAAALYSAGKTELLFGNEPFAAFHVSGGTTELTLVTPDNAYPRAVCIGGTSDLNAGQLIDRVGVMMGLKFPCGAALERLAEELDVSFPGVNVSVDGLNANLSGAENKARALYEKTNDKAATAAYTLDFVTKTLDMLTKNLRGEYPDISVIYAGGVMSCKRMRKTLGKRENVFFSEPEFSADNAAGIALIAYNRLTEGK